MKKSIVVLSFMSLFLVMTVSCNNKEKRIAELESRDAAATTENKVAVPSQEAGNAPGPNSLQKPEGPLPVMTFTETFHDFGTINEGDVVDYTYKFKNTGDAPLIIQGAQGSCGCTIPEWTKEPIPPGGEGIVTAKFNSQGKHNKQNKTVTVTANTWPPQTTVNFEANVIPKDTPAQ